LPSIDVARLSNPRGDLIKGCHGTFGVFRIVLKSNRVLKEASGQHHNAAEVTIAQHQQESVTNVPAQAAECQIPEDHNSDEIPGLVLCGYHVATLTEARASWAT
jgi:hypothetical protein